MDKTILASMEQMRSFDFVQWEHDVQVGLSWVMQDILSNMVQGTAVGGLTATQTSPLSLSFTLSAGRIYQISSNDATATGAIAQDLTQQCQQGLNAGQTITLVTPASGQSQWNLVQGQFQQVDQVRTGDPNGGIVPFYNSANPLVPTPTSINTVRRGLFVVQVIQGASATTGSEVPPTATAGWTPLYMVDLAGGQTTIQTSQIIKCGPSVGTGVPSNYPVAPFIRGLMASHHGGTNGQAPKVILGTETTGTLPYAQMSPVRTLLSGNLTLYVNASTGNDSNPGTSPGSPFLTIQGAINSIYHNYDFNGFVPTVSVANGAYTGITQISGSPVGMGAGSLLQIVGNVGSPGSVTVTTTNGSCFVCTIGASVNITGMTLSATGTGTSQGIGIESVSGSLVTFASVNFGACAVAGLYGTNGGIVQLTGGATTYTITGGGQAHIVANFGGSVLTNSANVTITGTPAFSSSFVQATVTGAVQAFSASYTGSATGVRYTANLNGVIYTNGGGANYFPGNSAGTTATGGQYA